MTSTASARVRPRGSGEPLLLATTARTLERMARPMAPMAGPPAAAAA